MKEKIFWCRSIEAQRYCEDRYKGVYMAIEQITYEAFMKKLDELEKRYRSDEKGFPPGAKEKGLEICEKFRREVTKGGPENFEYWIDTIYGLPMHKPIKRDL
jgi:hypothetical protein